MGKGASKIIGLDEARKRCESAACRRARRRRARTPTCTSGAGTIPEWERYVKGFETIADGKGQIDKETFLDAVLGITVPREVSVWACCRGHESDVLTRCAPQLSERIFHVFDTNHSGFIDKEEFLCGMAIFSHGKPEERIRFLFNVYDEDGNGTISRAEMARFLAVLRVRVLDRARVAAAVRAAC
jgi:hypothetical protein